MRIFQIFLLIIFSFFTILGVQTAHPAQASTHPSLYYTQAELNALKSLGTAPNHSTIWANIVAWADGHVNDEVPAYNATQVAQTVHRFLDTMVFMYHMTDNTDYRAAAITWMLGICDWTNWHSGSTHWQANSYIQMAMANGYYSLKDEMTEEDRATILAAMTSVTLGGYEVNNYGGSLVTPTFGYSYLPSNFPNHESTVGAAVGIQAIAMGDDYANSAAWLAFADDCIDRALSFGSDSTGGWVEGAGYFNFSLCGLARVMDVYNRFEHEDFLTTYSNFFSNASKFAWNMDATHYGVQATVQVEDRAGQAAWNSNGEPLWAYFLAKYYNDTYAQEFANDMAAQDYPMAFIWKDPNVVEGDHTDLPHYRVFTDLGYVIWRTGWAEEDTMFLFKSGRSMGHAHPNQNTYMIYQYGVPLTCDTGYATSWTEYKVTQFNNCITVGNILGNDGKLYGYGQAHEPGDVGGAVVPMGTSGDILATSFNDVYYYVSGDASALYTGQVYTETYDWPMYSSGDLDKWVRHVVFFPDLGYFVTFDDVVSPAEQQVNWWFSNKDLYNEYRVGVSENPPPITWDGDLMTTKLPGKAPVSWERRIEIKMLEPTSFTNVIEPNGGCQSSEFTYTIVYPTTDVISPKFLTVMTADNHLSNGNLQTTKIEQGNCLGAIVDSSNYRDVVLFSRDGNPVNQYIELGGYYQSADGNPYIFNGTQVLADFDTYQVMRLELTGGNQPPVLAPIGNKSVTEGQQLEFTITATDPDSNPMTYSASNLPEGTVFNPATRAFSWTPATGQEGTYPNVRFEVSDGSLTDLENIAITVTANQAPVLAAIGNKEVQIGLPLQFTVSATDPDGDPLTYSASNLPTGASFDSAKRLFFWNLALGDEGVYPNIHFKVSDGGLSDIEDITITVVVTSGGNANDKISWYHDNTWWLWLTAGFIIVAIVVIIMWLRQSPINNR